MLSEIINKYDEQYAHIGIELLHLVRDIEQLLLRCGDSTHIGYNLRNLLTPQSCELFFQKFFSDHQNKYPGHDSQKAAHYQTLRNWGLNDDFYPVRFAYWPGEYWGVVTKAGTSYKNLFSALNEFEQKFPEFENPFDDVQDERIIKEFKRGEQLYKKVLTECGIPQHYQICFRNF